MSRSNNNETLQNPANKFFEWSGSEGKLKWYDKETKQNVFVDLPFGFLVLDILTTITGYSKSHDNGIWSNEVKDLRKEPLTVRTKGALIAEGLYSDIKEKIKAEGANYTQSVYIAYKTENGLAIGNLKLAGSSIGPWIEFRKQHDVYKGAVAITGATDEKNGGIKFKSPTFAAKQTTEETDAQAVELDKQLQEYLKAYFSRRDEHIPEEVGDSSFVTAAAGAITSSINGTRVQDPTEEAPYTVADAPDDLDLPF